MSREQQALKRAGLYAFFSFLMLNEPDADVIDPYKANFMREFFKESKLPGELIAHGEREAEALRADHVALFIAPGDRYVMPYESVYTDKDPLTGRGLVMGPSTLRVKEFYAKTGLSPLGELPDHAGMEMAFMGLLCEKEAEQWKAGDRERAEHYLDLEKEFLQQHLIKWIDEYLDAIYSKAGTGFYRAAAMLAKDYIRREIEYLK